jgi:uncharacterized membrane-anchored protein
VAELHLKGWLQPPTLDRATATVYWALDATEGDLPTVNSVALRLGRNGVERFNWITPKDEYVAIGGQLDTMLRAHSFAPGTAYADHVSTDKTAEYGIAALVATVLGAKAIKAGVAAGGLAVLGKFFAPLLAGIGAVFYKIFRPFRRKTAAVMTKKCASCGEAIEREALSCRHCHAAV